MLNTSLPRAKELVNGKNVLLIGSSPAASLQQLCDRDVVVCVNASFSPFPDLVPDLLFVNGYTTRNQDTTARASMQQMINRRCNHLVCISSSQTFEEMQNALIAAGLVFNTSEEITKVERAALVSRALGRPTKSDSGNDVASTGVSALLVLQELGAKKIKLTGFSLEGGHSYIQGTTQRAHVEIDREILEAYTDMHFDIRSESIPSMYSRYEAYAQRVMLPILNATQNGIKQSMPVEAHPERKAVAPGHTHLEAIARLFAGFAPWWESKACSQDTDCASESWLNSLFDRISDPDSPDYLNFNQGTQPLVDVAFLCLGFLRAPTLWGRLSEKTQTQLIAAIQSSRVIRPHFNNWLLFSAIIEAFFYKQGMAYDPMRIDYALRQHEQWYLGDGVYGDGPELHIDYYNSFVIHPFLLELLWATKGLYSDWDKLTIRCEERAQRHATQLERMIGPDGTYPPLGRSLSYRCGAFHLLALLAWRNLLPSEMKPAQVRCALLAVIEKTLSNPVNYDTNGWLRIGLNGSQPILGENYISTGSLYLCSTAFLPLGLAENEPFWRSPDEPWTQRKLWWRNEDIPLDKALKI